MSGDVPPLSHMLPLTSQEQPYLYLYLYPYKLRNSRHFSPRQEPGATERCSSDWLQSARRGHCRPEVVVVVV